MWVTSPLEVEIYECPEWIKSVVSEQGGFYKISISVGANELESAREGMIDLKLGPFYAESRVASITINQAGK